MSATFIPLLQGALVSNSLGDLYTAPGLRVRIDRFEAINQSGSAATLTLRVRPAASGSDANPHRIYIAVPIPGDGVPVSLPGMLRTLAGGDRIRAVSDVASAISIFADGVRFQ